MGKTSQIKIESVAPYATRYRRALVTCSKRRESDSYKASHELERIADAGAGCSHIQQIPGIGPIVAPSIVAAIGNGAAFRNGREFAAWLGLVAADQIISDSCRRRISDT